MFHENKNYQHTFFANTFSETENEAKLQESLIHFGKNSHFLYLKKLIESLKSQINLKTHSKTELNRIKSNSELKLTEINNFINKNQIFFEKKSLETNSVIKTAAKNSEGNYHLTNELMMLNSENKRLTA